MLIFTPTGIVDIPLSSLVSLTEFFLELKRCNSERTQWTGFWCRSRVENSIENNALSNVSLVFRCFEAQGYSNAGVNYNDNVKANIHVEIVDRENSILLLKSVVPRAWPLWVGQCYSCGLHIALFIWHILLFRSFSLAFSTMNVAFFPKDHNLTSPQHNFGARREWNPPQEAKNKINEPRRMADSQKNEI